MTRYNHVQKLSNAQFRRLIGVKRETFDCMMRVLRKSIDQRYRHAGRPSKLCLEDKALMTLEYLREYRTYFHLSQSYGVSESSVIAFADG